MLWLILQLEEESAKFGETKQQLRECEEHSHNRFTFIQSFLEASAKKFIFSKETNIASATLREKHIFRDVLR